MFVLFPKYHQGALEEMSNKDRGAASQRSYISIMRADPVVQERR